MQALGEGTGVTGRTSRNWIVGGVAALLALLLALAWRAGGEQDMREISVQVAVPEAAR